MLPPDARSAQRPSGPRAGARSPQSRQRGADDWQGRGASPRWWVRRAAGAAGWGGWFLQAAGVGLPTGRAADVQGLLAFLAGAIISLLLFALALVLLRERRAALALAERRSGELRHQAMHDSLTGLPNRVLALDRAEQMLVRSRRERTPVAALCIDLDRFKQINDTFGTAVGDIVLRTVAAAAAERAARRRLDRPPWRRRVPRSGRGGAPGRRPGAGRRAPAGGAAGAL